MALEPIALETYKGLVGQQVGTAPWVLMDQQRINGFAKITDDHQFIHVDPVAAADTPFGGTIAQGFLTLSMLSAMGLSIFPPIIGAEMQLNYGFNNVRFLQPVRSGKRIRGVFTLKSLNERSPNQWQSTYAVTVEIEGEEKPALVAEWVSLAILSPQ